MGCTSLWFNVLSEHKKAATLLLERSANEYFLDNDGVAMLEYVMSMKMLKMLLLLHRLVG